jgi:hypothetical protein
MVIAFEQGWRISNRFNQNAIELLLRILKEERDMGRYLLTAFQRVRGELPEWAQVKLTGTQERRAAT